MKTIFSCLKEEDFELMITNAMQNLIKKQQPETPAIVWVSRKDAARHLKISLVTLDKYTKQGKIPAYRVGKKKMYSYGKLNEFIESNIIRFK